MLICMHIYSFSPWTPTWQRTSLLVLANPPFFDDARKQIFAEKQKREGEKSFLEYLLLFHFRKHGPIDYLQMCQLDSAKLLICYLLAKYHELVTKGVFMFL